MDRAAGEKDNMPYSDESQSTQHHVYVAYCEKDLNFAEEIINKIEKEGLRCYFKDRDEKNGYILENMCEEVERSQFILIIYTENSLKDVLIKFLAIHSLQCNLDFGQVSIILLLHNLDKKKLPKEIQIAPHVFTSEENYFRCMMDKLTAPKMSVDDLLPVGNISSGLAWSFYYGYLNIILPEIPFKIDEWIKRNPSKKNNFPRQIYILLPTSGKCYDSLSSVDENIKYVEILPTQEINRAGNMCRKYQNTIYKICKQDKEYYLVGEYATPVKTMFEMERGKITGLTKSDLMVQVHFFKEKLSEILNHKNCPYDCCTLVIYNNEKPLSDVLMEEIEKS